MSALEQNLADGWLETQSGLQFFFQNPNADMICIEDIAASLSKTCRYNGHTNRHYSVAHHSILMAEWLLGNSFPARVALQALLHDATETYIGDMVRPLKGMFPEFKSLEKLLWGTIAIKFGVPVAMYDVVKELDTRILVDERKEFMPNTDNDWGLDGVEGLGVEFDDWGAADVETYFLQDFHKYNRELKG